MDPRIPLSSVDLEVALQREVEKTRIMQESLREDEAKLRKKELERQRLLEMKEQALAQLKTGENLFALLKNIIVELDDNNEGTDIVGEEDSDSAGEEDSDSDDAGEN